MRRFLRLALIPLLLTGCGSNGSATAPSAPPPPPPPGAPPPPPGTGARPVLREIAQGLSFPVHLASPPGDARLFVVEKVGTVRIVKDGALVDTPFLDLSGDVSQGGEQGLLSIAFHPRYAENGRFFVYYTDRGGDIRIVERRVSNDPDRADPSPVRNVITVEHSEHSNHNGGLVVFGPDGKLYAGFGDGGAGGDPDENGQNLGTLLGSIVRLDVDAAQPYAAPSDNPFVDRSGARGEIWAYGVRNPWRFSFDRANGDFYLADVGQNEIEEVDAVRAAEAGGKNYGWDVMEGSSCFEPPEGCDRTGLTLPVTEYDNGDDGCSITGGFVYRGPALPDLQGTYFYSDFCTGFVRSFELSGTGAAGERSWADLEPGGNVTSFGEDAAGEIYVLTSNGGVFKIVPE
ncbi:MAG: PQQ-dependent sugar dehydrogenase [Gemmatimonadetes bacterium]|nr:PQQ-dependent sugar dehydrogenase [Gemmatimonadota bacterium]